MFFKPVLQAALSGVKDLRLIKIYFFYAFIMYIYISIEIASRQLILQLSSAKKEAAKIYYGYKVISTCC